MEVTSNRLSDNSPVRITFRLVGEIQKEDATYTQVFLSQIQTFASNSCVKHFSVCIHQGDEYHFAAMPWNVELDYDETRLLRLHCSPGYSRKSTILQIRD